MRAPAVGDCRTYVGLSLAWSSGARGDGGYTQWRPCRHAQSGQGLVEYGVILMIMAVACIVSLVFFGDQLSSLLSLIASAV